MAVKSGNTRSLHLLDGRTVCNCQIRISSDQRSKRHLIRDRTSCMATINDLSMWQ